MPEEVIKYFLHFINTINPEPIRVGISRKLNIPERTLGWILIVLLTFFGSISVYLIYGLNLSLVYFLISILFFILLRIEDRISHTLVDDIMTFLIIVLGGVPAILWLQLMLQYDIMLSFIVVLFLFPVYWIMVYMIFVALTLPITLSPFNFESEKKMDELLPIFGFSVSVSFFITFLSLLIGRIATPTAWLPQTLQMLISNVIFDGLTVVTTFYILSWAISKKTMLRIPIAILADLFLASLYAVFSLFYGLLFTSHALSLWEVFNVLIGLSPSGTVWEIGPFFWAMHTTFIPTVIYLGIIFIAWTGKLILLPINRFCEIGQEHENPLLISAGLCTLFAVIFGYLSQFVKSGFF